MPLVTILMAIYKPNLNWLIEQLQSLNNQEYNNLDLLVWNDNPDDLTDYEAIYSQYITRFPYRIFKGNENLGSNGAFEELTKIACSEYIAYCDQDDIWLSEKISILVAEAHRYNADLVCSDMYVIDKAGKIIANSITEVRRFQKLYTGREQFKYLISHNFVTGCTVLAKSTFAKQTLPFPKEYIHDWWLALHAASRNSLYIINKPLIKYRIHDNNQTSTFAGIVDKDSYYEKRILQMSYKINILYSSFGSTKLKNLIDKYSDLSKIRDAYYKKPKILTFYALYKRRELDRLTVFFELLMPIIPEWLFRLIAKKINQKI